jgi:hypothetical protein
MEMQKGVRGGGVVCIASKFLQSNSILLFLVVATLQVSDFFVEIVDGLRQPRDVDQDDNMDV